MKIEKPRSSSRMASFKYAFAGLKIFFKTEFHAKVHSVCALLTSIAAFLLDVSAYEWIAILLAIGLVFTSEILNTAIEHLADFSTVERNEKIKVIKDLAAAAVLVAAIVAFMIGAVIFIPKLLALTSPASMLGR